MGIVEHTSCPRVFDYFEEIAGIPHGSGNTKRLSEHCAVFAAAHGLTCRRDAAGNVVIHKPASPGRETEEAVLLQGHLDMVAAQEEGLAFDFLRDGLRLRREGDFLTADGTTLGGDDGIAVAMCLAILEDDSLSHPPLECVFTVDEEIGMLGAEALDTSDLTATRLLNLDCEEEGVLTVGCAGGSRVRLCFPAAGREVMALSCRIRIEGLIGGHSGTEIHRNRINANHLMATLLSQLTETCPTSLGEFVGGAADNAIPSSATALLAVPTEKQAEMDSLLAAVQETWQREIRQTEPDFSLTWTWEAQPGLLIVSEELTRLLPLFAQLPDGVQAMCEELPDMVETSLNLGIVKWENDQLHLSFSVRSSVEEEKHAVERELISLAESYGGTASVDGDYPGWPVQSDSRLRKTASRLWEEMTGRPMRAEAIHAGLECGIFLSKMPGLDIIAMGPEMQDIHTPRERLSISSTERVYAFLRELLAAL